MNVTKLRVEKQRIRFDGLSHATNPYNTYRKLREYHPACRVEPGGIWVISRFQDVRFALSREDLFQQCDLGALRQPEWLLDDGRLNTAILFNAPLKPLQPTLRGIHAAKALIGSLEPFMRKSARILINAIRQQANIAFVRDFARPYTAGVINRVLGIDQYPTADRDRRWAELLGTLPSTVPGEHTAGAISAAIRRQYNIFDNVVRERREQPADDLATALVRATGDGGDLHTVRALCRVFGLLVALGFQVGKCVLARSVLYLARNPSRHQLLATAPEKIPAFIEEMLRCDSPVHGVLRCVRKNVHLACATIPAGEPVLLLVASANRDPSHFTDPDHVDLWRHNLKDHLAFGYGEHVDLGAALARQELRVALEEIVTAFTRIECPDDSQLDWSHGLSCSRLRELPVRLP